MNIPHKHNVCVCVRVNHLSAKVSLVILQGAEAPIQTPLLTKLVCMW